MLKLTERLQKVADLVCPCACVADIGTDHAYLPAWLLLNGKAEHAIAADIHEKPLQNARKTLEKFALLKKIELRLSDGLQNFADGEAEEIVVAGMGGEQIADMILATPWLWQPHIHLTLQPMTHFEEVRLALYAKGFTILQEKTVAEGNRVYLVISARYTGHLEEQPAWFAYGGLLAKKRQKSETDRILLANICKRLQVRANAMQNRAPQEANRLQNIVKELSDER